MKAFQAAGAQSIERSVFDKPIGMIAEACVEHDNAAAESIKAEMFALLKAEDRLDEGDLPKNRFGELNAFQLGADKRSELLAKAGVSEDELKAAKDEVAKADFSGEGMPLYGDILVANGFVDRETKTALLMVQAAVRAQDIVQRIEAGEAREPERAFDFSKFGAFNDPVELVNAQLLHRAAYEKELAVAAGTDDMLKVDGFKAAADDALAKAANTLDAQNQPAAAAAARSFVSSKDDGNKIAPAPVPRA